MEEGNTRTKEEQTAAILVREEVEEEKNKVPDERE